MRNGRTHLKILEFFLKQVIAFGDQENLSGDFEEMFERISRKSGTFTALLWYICQILKMVPSYFRNYTNWSLSMLKNYLKVTIRNIKKSKTYSFINIFGLAIGIACCLLILFYIQDELSFDRYHENADRIFRVVDSGDAPGGMSFDLALTSAPFAPTMKSEFPEVEDAARFYRVRRMVANGDIKYYEDNLFFCDASVFSIFTFPLLKGNPKTALQDPNTVVLSENTAQKYFGNEDPLNKTLNINGKDCLVTGIMKNIPRNSHFHAELFASFRSLEQIPIFQQNYLENWVRHEFYTYILLVKGHSYKELEAKMPDFIEKFAAEPVKAMLGGTITSSLQPLKRIHLHSHLQVELMPNSDIKYIYIFSFIGMIILLIACINFMNLATARSAKRSLEVGLRKVVGANRTQLIRQFLGESLMFTFLALLFALLILTAVLPSFNTLTGKEIHIQDLGNGLILGGMLLLILFVGFASGSYPAFFLSKYQPANVLKGAASRKSAKFLLRQGLVVFQFTISIILIISTTVVIHQLDFLQNKKLGFDKEHIVVVPLTAEFRQNAETVKDELKKNPNVVDTTVTHSLPGGMTAGDVVKLLRDEGDLTLTVRIIYTDYDYIQTLGLEVVEGRNFTKDRATDKNEAFIVNEAAVQAWQLDKPLETRLQWGGPLTEGGKEGPIIGVVKDFQFQSLKEEINPLVIMIEPSNTLFFAIRVRPEEISATLSFIESIWKKFEPARPYEFHFMDESFDRIYKNEERLSQIFGIFSTLAILIAAMGLFGLTLFMVEQKTKEIGVRKVLGASMGNIFLLISKEFARLVLFANLFAWPAGYLLMRRWLQNFSYRIDIEIWIFILAGFIAFCIALFTISFLAVKAALSDPVKSLRYE